MATNHIKDADIREYLLGNAPPEASETLDELSFADEIAERIGAAEFDLIDEYLNGSLSGRERSAFEGHYLSSPLRRGKVNFARSLAEHAERTGLFSALAEQDKKRSILDILKNWHLSLQFGAALAGLLLVAALGLLMYRNASNTGDSGPTVAQNIESPASANPTSPSPASTAPTAQPPTAAVGQGTEVPVSERPTTPKPAPRAPKAEEKQVPRPAIFILTPALRGSDHGQAKAAKPGVPVELRLVLEAEADSPYSAEIVDARTQSRVWTAKSLAAKGGASLRTVNLLLPASTVKAGQYGISVYATNKEGKREKVGDYSFTVAP